MKKYIRLLACVLSAIMLLCACNNSIVNVKPEDLNVPQFADGQSVTIGVWSGSMAAWTDEQFHNLQNANINLLLGSSEYIVYSKQFFDQAESVGVKVIPDSRSWNGQVPEFIDHPAFAGYCVWDEPASTDFQALAEKKALWDSAMGDKTFFVNVFPGWAGNALGGSFKSYISNYINTVKPEVLCFDHYPLMEDSYGETIVRDSFFSDMDICSHYAKEAGIPFWFTLLTSGHMNYVVPTTDELRWQMAVGQAYGAKGLVHYVYASHDPDYTCPIDWNSQTTTDLYDCLVEANAEVAAWDHIYMNYNWKGTANVKGSNNTMPSIQFQLCQFAVKPTDHTCITAIESTEDLLCGIFEDGKGGEGFMLTNATNPAEGKNATVKLTLNETYKGVLIIDRGVQSVKALTDQTISINVESSEGVFIIPLTAK